MDSYQSNVIPVIQESVSVRSQFIRKTYLHLAVAVLAFIFVEAIFLSTPFIVQVGLAMTQGFTWLIVLGGFMFVTSYAEKWASESTDRRMQYVALGIYILAEAFIFVPLLYIAVAISGDFALIQQAGVMTLALFGGLTAVVFMTQKDFSMLRAYISVGGMVALGLIAAGLIFGFSLGLWFSFAMVLLASASILYQTSAIMKDYNQTQYVAAALGLFASLMLLFWYILSILSRFSGD